MAPLAPDIPELEQVPYAARSIVYMRAFNLAVRSGLTWVMGGIAFGAAVGIGANQGSAVLGRSGAVLGTLAGIVAGIWCFLKVILPWRARRNVPSVISQPDDGVLDAVRQAEAELQRMVEAHRRRESGGAPGTTQRRGPDRLP